MRAAGWVVGYIGGCDEGASWAWRSLFSPTCQDDVEEVSKHGICISEFPNIRDSRIRSQPNRYIPGYPPAYPRIPG